MGLSIEVLSSDAYFCDLVPVSHAHENQEKIRLFLEKFRAKFWENPPIQEISPAFIATNIPLAFLAALITKPLEALSANEKAILYPSKNFEKKTLFYLNHPGAAMLVVAGVACGIINGLSFYYGVNQSSVDSVNMAIMLGVAAAVATVASNMLGFYITGTLPHNASEAENKEQNMWDDFAILKTKPAAYQLLNWFSPVKGESESEEKFIARRKLADYFITHLAFDEIIDSYKKLATQHEKIDIAFRPLLEIKDIIEAQKKHEISHEMVFLPIQGDFVFLAKLIGYFKY